MHPTEHLDRRPLVKANGEGGSKLDDEIYLAARQKHDRGEASLGIHVAEVREPVGPDQVFGSVLRR